MLMNQEEMKETAEEVAKCAAICASKQIVMTEDEYEFLKKCIKREIMIGFAGEIAE